MVRLDRATFVRGECAARNVAFAAPDGPVKLGHDGVGHDGVGDDGVGHDGETPPNRSETIRLRPAQETGDATFSSCRNRAAPDGPFIASRQLASATR